MLQLAANRQILFSESQSSSLILKSHHSSLKNRKRIGNESSDDMKMPVDGIFVGPKITDFYVCILRLK
jgi:hypothetical protein